MAEDIALKQLLVDLSVNTGALKYGATGFLYGLGNNGIPNANMLSALRPQVAAQKPEGGAQHPNGDALDVAGMYRSANGKEIEIYLQDHYANWPYEFTGIEDYLNRLDGMLRQVTASLGQVTTYPNHGFFSYVPFNEPDQIWYNKTDKKQAFFEDWLAVYQKIKSLDPAPRIVGPNFACYDSQFYRDFVAYTKWHDCLPDVISWHELNDDFFTGWYTRYQDFREIERSLGIPPKEICINEYARIKGDLGIPGKLIQWITRFENSKVDACLAYWTDAGSLNNLVTPDHYNRATGGWWLYEWYGGLSGHTVQVTPLEVNAEGLQGLASADPEKKQVRILLGGASGSAAVVIRGLSAMPDFQNQIHAKVWAIDSSGLNPSDAPRLLTSGNYLVEGDQVSVRIEDMVDSSAYQVILTPRQRLSQPRAAHTYAAQFAHLIGEAFIDYAAENVPVVLSPKSSPAGVEFVVTAPTNGFYEIRLRYAVEKGNVHLVLNGSPLLDLHLDNREKARLNLFLMTGINLVAFRVDPGTTLRIEGLEVRPGKGPVSSYEAEAEANTLSGTAAIMHDPAASGGKYVGQIGSGAENNLAINQIHVRQPGIYHMVVHFANAEFRGGHSYNSQVVDRSMEIRVNDGAGQRVYFRNTFDWHNYQTRVVEVELRAGNNTIRFSNSSPNAYAPNIDRIEIASPIGDLITGP